MATGVAKCERVSIVLLSANQDGMIWHGGSGSSKEVTMLGKAPQQNGWHSRLSHAARRSTNRNWKLPNTLRPIPGLLSNLFPPSPKIFVFVQVFLIPSSHHPACVSPSLSSRFTFIRLCLPVESPSLLWITSWCRLSLILPKPF